MTVFQGYDGELRLYEYGDGTTRFYYEVLFCEMDFNGPISRGKTEETLIMDRGRYNYAAHYIQGDDQPVYGPYPFSFSCRLADTVTTPVLIDWLSGVTQIVTGTGTTTLITWMGKTTLAGDAAPSFSDGSKMRYRLECLWDGTNDLGFMYDEVYFPPEQQTVTESPDGLMLNANGLIYSNCSRISQFDGGATDQNIMDTAA